MPGSCTEQDSGLYFEPDAVVIAEYLSEPSDR